MNNDVGCYIELDALLAYIDRRIDALEDKMDIEGSSSTSCHGAIVELEEMRDIFHQAVLDRGEYDH